MKCLLSFILLAFFATNAQAIILAEKADRNTRKPSGVLLDSGWQYEGDWGEFLGTTISQKFFITAGHIGGNVGDNFIWNGKAFTTIATYNDPNSDLQLWQIHGRFPLAAPLFKENSESGRAIVMFGRGTQRGSEIDVNGQVKGWRWGADDSMQSWGKNIITGTTAGTADNNSTVNDGRIYWTFDRNGIAHEGALSGGDSGGGVFTKTGGVWRLIGVNNATQADFSLPNSNIVDEGAIMDFGGLVNDDSLIPDTTADVPAQSYATRISTSTSWIYDVLAGKISPSESSPRFFVGAVPEPSMIGILIFGVLLKRRTRT
jgi:hypothetical protein